MTLSPELKQAIEKADDQPVRVEDPETQTAYVVIREDDCRRLRNAVPESDFALHEFEELRPRQKGEGSDEPFRPSKASQHRFARDRRRPGLTPS
jgi:hypothetical protein